MKLLNDRVLDRWAASRDGCDSMIALSRQAIGDARRPRRKHIERYAAGADQHLLHVGYIGIEELHCGRVQVMSLPELSDSSSFPGLPCVLCRAGKRLAITLEHVTSWPRRASHHRRQPNSAALIQGSSTCQGFLLQAPSCSGPEIWLREATASASILATRLSRLSSQAFARPNCSMRGSRLRRVSVIHW